MQNFLNKYKGKRHFVIKSDKPKFNKHFSWEQFDNYLNQVNIGSWDRTPQLQIVLPNGDKWCKKKSPEKKSREEVTGVVERRKGRRREDRKGEERK